MTREEYEKLVAGTLVRIVEDPVTGAIYGRTGLPSLKGKTGRVTTPYLYAGNVLEVNTNLNEEHESIAMVNPHCLEVVRVKYERARYHSLDGQEDGWAVVYAGTAKKVAFFADSYPNAEEAAQKEADALNAMQEGGSHE